MIVHRLNEAITVVDVVVDEICVEEPQEDGEEETICSEDEDEQRQ